MKKPLSVHVKHFLQFRDAKPVQIAEPDKFDAANFVTMQDKGRLGRDVSFASGTVELSFNPDTEYMGLTHRFDKLIFEYENNGFEADIKYILRISQNDTNYEDFVIGQLDFGQPDTDILTFFDCKVIQENEQAIIKRRMDTKINLFGNETLDGDTIEPLQTEKVLLKAVPEKQEGILSVVEQELQFFIPNENRDYYHNPFVQVDNSELETMIPGFLPSNPLSFDGEDFVVINAFNTLKNFQFSIENLKLNYEGQITDDILLKIYMQKGSSFDFNNATVIYEQYSGSNTLSVNNVSYQSPVMTLSRDEKLYIVFDIRLSDTPNGLNHQLYVNPISGTFKATATSFSIASVFSGVKYVDAMRQVLKNITGLTLKAPQFEKGKKLHPQYITNGLLLRNITENAFNISLKDLIEHLGSEWNGDYEIEDNNFFFVGLYEDFYRDVEIGKYEQVPNEEYRETIAEKYAIKDFSLNYKKYEKSNDQQKSRESVHTSIDTFLPNKFADNSKKVSIPFIRDAFLIEKTRKDAIKVTEDTATENDEDIFIIDVIEKNISFSETFQVNHVVGSPTDLVLTNDGSFNWTLMGMKVNDFIEFTGQNGGDWRIFEIAPKSLTLVAVGGTTATYSGLELITMDYNVTATNLTNRTNEGFTIITNTSSPEGFSNLRFTPKRNILKYWADYLGTATFYHKNFGENIKVTEFIHNGDLETRRTDEVYSIVENAEIGPFLLSRTLEPKMIETVVYATFLQYRATADRLRKDRGYVSVQRPNGDIKKVHPTLLDYDISNDTMIIKGYKRYER